MSIRGVARAVVADDVRDAAQRDRALEQTGVPHDPVGHESAVTAAGDAESSRIDPRIPCDRRRHAAHHVDVVLTAPLVHDPALELAPISGRAARIREEHRPSLRGVDLELVIPVDAVLARGSAVDAEDHRILLAGLEPYGLYEKSV